jgi:dolichyl-phosphate-mannose-protein mannosyltransferase
MPRFAAASAPVWLIWPGLPLLYLVLPGHPLGLFSGVPLGDLAVGCGLVVGLLAWVGARPGAWLVRRAVPVVVLAGGLKLVLAAVALPYGLAASYWTSSDPAAAAERSTEWLRVGGGTRVDRGLSLAGDQFPLYFFNDFKRFNYYTANQPRRDLLPFSVIWRGWLTWPDTRAGCLQLAANGSASLQLETATTERLAGLSHVEARTVCAVGGSGMSPLEVRFSRPEGGVPYLVVSEVTEDGGTRPLAGERLLRAPSEPGRIQLDRWLGWVAWWLDLLTVSAVGLVLTRAAWEHGRRGWRGLGWERPLLAGSVLVAFGEGLANYRHFAGRTPLLSGGNDWLAYETFARDIAFNGLLMTGGKAPGQGEAFYYQPLYAYFLAGLHWLVGESVYGPLVAQYTLVAVAGVLCYLLARELFGRAAALATLGLFWAFRYLIFDQVADLLLSENLVALIVPAMLLLLVRWTRTWRRSDLVGGSVLIGLAILARTTPLLFLPPALLLLGRAQWRKFGQRRAAPGAAGLALLVTLAVFSLAPIRNYLVAGRAVLLPESASTNIYETHRPSARVDLSRVDRDPLYNRLGLDRRTREVAEFIRQDPLGYAATLVPMGLYPLGITGPALGTGQVQVELLLLSGLYLLGLCGLPAARTVPAWLVHAFVLTHFGQMMVFMSHQYGFRLPLPMYGPMLAIGGAALLALVRPLGRLVGRPAVGRAQLVAGVAVGLALVWSGLQIVRTRDVEDGVFGLGGDAAPAARAVRAAPDSWQADRLYFGGVDRRSSSVAYLPGLAYREMKWFDQSAALVWPAEGERGLLVLARSSEPALLAECWSAAARQAELAGPGAERVIRPVPPAAERSCLPGERPVASFAGLLDLLGTRVTDSNEGGSGEVRVAWRVAQRPGFGVPGIVEARDGNGAMVGTTSAEPYAAGSWEAGEVVVARLKRPSPTEPAAGGDLALSFGRGGTANRLSIDDPLPLFGQTRLQISR